MPRLPLVSGREVVKALIRLGFDKHHQTGSHVIMKHRTDPSRRTSVPQHPELRPGTLLAILRDSGVSREQLIEALR
jgi:predicted RNA binding protein YcfA (HicA-like mRNA interferase family)